MKLVLLVISTCFCLTPTIVFTGNEKEMKLYSSSYYKGLRQEMKLSKENFFKNFNPSVKYEPNWKSLDTRPLPSWYDEAKFGIFIHWGVFSVPSFGEWFWWHWKGDHNINYVKFMADNYPPKFTYADFGPQFTNEFYDPHVWADIFQSSGAKYVVLTSKHHEGYTLWPSKYSWNWNAMDVGPKRDLLGDLAQAIRTNTTLKFGLYHSLYEWFHPLYLQDKENNFTSQLFVHSKTMPELYELVETYRPSVVWSDGDWEARDTYWNATNFLAWLFNDSPVKDEVVVNDRWGSEVACNHGDFFTCTDHYNPGVLQPHKWENCLTIDSHSWGYRRNAPLSDYRSTYALLKELIETVSCGGNMLLNVGPTKDGIIPAIFEERLRDMGQWLGINGNAIYGTNPWIYQNDTRTSNVWYTSKQNTVYGIVLFWPSNGVVDLGAPMIGPGTQVMFLGYNGPIDFTSSSPGIKVTFPDKSLVSNDWAWVIQFDNLIN